MLQFTKKNQCSTTGSNISEVFFIMKIALANETDLSAIVSVSLLDTVDSKSSIQTRETECLNVFFS